MILMKLISGRTQDLAAISRILGGATELQLEKVRSVVHQYLTTASEALESLIVLDQLEKK